jgi:sialate O-acetylesterase
MSRLTRLGLFYECVFSNRKVGPLQMKSMNFVRSSCFFFLLSAVPLMGADLLLAPLFQDGAVLQRDRDIPVWGKASPNAEVTVSFAGQRIITQAGPDGRWLVHLPSQSANAVPQEMTISSSGEILTIKNILIGEVWLASGQSNMGWRINQSRREDQDMATQGPVPSLRIFTVPRELHHAPQFSVGGNWQPATPDTVPQFTAVGYFFGRNLVENLGVPVGIINSSWGGSKIEPWWDEEGLDGIGELTKIREERRPMVYGTPEYRSKVREYAIAMSAWSKQALTALDAGQDAPLAPGAPPPLLSLGRDKETGLYQAMIHPLAPYAIRGFVWYQGEGNVADGMLYAAKKRALIQGWRKRFQSPDAPFFFVQIAPYNYGKARPDQLPQFWVAQQKTLAIPNTGMVVTLDIGNVRDIHPRNKSEVGRRLALWALADTYGLTEMVKSGPLYLTHRVADDTIVVEFEHLGSGLATRDDKSPSHFEIAGSDGKFKPAITEISEDGRTIILRSAEVTSPQQARFAWHKTAEPNLMNREGLPAAAFHTHWPK